MAPRLYGPTGQLLTQYDTGTIQVIKDLFDIRQGGASGVVPNFQPVAEARAIRPWELYAESIVAWGFRVNAAAVAGEFSGVGIAMPPSAPPGWLIIVTKIRSEPSGAATSFVLQSTQAANAATYALNGSNRYRDTRWGISQAVPQEHVEVRAGSDAAVFGTALTNLRNPSDIWEGFHVLGRDPLGNNPALNIQSNVVLQTITVEVEGLVVVPRQ